MEAEGATWVVSPPTVLSPAGTRGEASVRASQVYGSSDEAIAGSDGVEVGTANGLSVGSSRAGPIGSVRLAPYKTNGTAGPKDSAETLTR